MIGNRHKQKQKHKAACLSSQAKAKIQGSHSCKTKKKENVGQKNFDKNREKSKVNSKSSKSKKSEESQYQRNEQKKRGQYYNQENFMTEKKIPRKQKSSNFAVSSPFTFRMPNYRKKKSHYKKSVASSVFKVRNSQFYERTPSKENISTMRKRKSQRSSILFPAGKSQRNPEVISKSESKLVKSQNIKATQKNAKKVKSKTPTKQIKKSFQKTADSEKERFQKCQNKEKQKYSKNSVKEIGFAQSQFLQRNQEKIPKLSFIDRNETNINQIRSEIVEEFYLEKDQQLLSEIFRERLKSINMLAKICYSMSLKKSSFLLTLAYLDRFLDNRVSIESIKAATIASLIISLKVQHAEVFGQIQHQFSESTSCESREVPGLKTPQLTIHKRKLPNVLNVVLSHQQIFSEYDKILGRDEIYELEMQIISKLNFRLEVKSINFWLETLLREWELFLEKVFKDKNYPETKISKKYLEFRYFQNTLGLLPILVQICGICEIVALPFPKPVIVLSVMYLLLRVSVYYSSSEWEKGFQHFRIQLSKSANVIFIDKKGCNQVFGDFLNIYGLDLSSIISCCQSISRYFSYSILKRAIEQSRKEHCKKDFSLYFYSSDLFRFIASRLLE